MARSWSRLLGAATSASLLVAGLAVGSVAQAAHHRPAGVKTGGTLVIGESSADVGNWDPVATYEIPWATVMNNVFEGLTFRNPQLQLQPGLATSWKYLNPTTLQFQLRKGVTFQDGEPFNATAVQYTFNRLLGPAGAKGPEQGNYTSIKSVQVVNPYEVIFHLRAPDPSLLTKLSGYGAVIVPPQYIQKHGAAYFADHPIGTGPFMVTKYVRGSEIVLTRYPHYWRGPAYLQTVIYKFLPEDSTRLADLQTGAINVMQAVPIPDVPLLKSNPAYTTYVAVTPTVYEFGFDVTQPPVNNVLVRRAINMAINVPAIIKAVLKGYAKPISSYQGPLSFGNDPNLKPIPYDPAKAKALLKQAGVKAGTPITIGYDGTDTTFQEVAQAAASYLDAVGFKVTLMPVEQNTFYNQDIPDQKAGQMFEFGWGGWTLDFDNTAYLLYMPKQFYNPSFSNPEVSKLILAERSTNNVAARRQDFYKLDTLLQQLEPGVNLYDTEEIWATSSNVQNFVAPPDDRLWLWHTWVK